MSKQHFSIMLRERNTFVLKARSGNDERLHAITLNVNVREQDLAHFNGRSGAGGDKTVQGRWSHVVAVAVSGCWSCWTAMKLSKRLMREMGDLRQLDQLIKTKAKDGTHTLELPDVTVQWQVAEEPGLPNVLQRVQGDDGSSQQTTGRVPSTAEPDGKYRPLPVRKLVVAVWMYPPHVEIPPTGDRIPVASDATTQDFFGKDDAESVEESEDRSLKRSAEKPPALHDIFHSSRREQDMGCAASTERQVELWPTKLEKVMPEFAETVRVNADADRLTRSNMVLHLGKGRRDSYVLAASGMASIHSADVICTLLTQQDWISIRTRFCQIIGRTLHSRKSKKPIHAFGFGDSRTADRYVFTFLPTEVLAERYTEITPELVLGGPTNFAPISITPFVKLKRVERVKYSSLSQVTSEKETSQAVAEASKYALSIIVVGVGDGPWKEMEQYKSTLPTRKFENFHFVNLNRVMRENPEQPALSLAIAALAHIPDQLAAIRRLGLLQTSKND
ncbi:Copine [Phytophthora cactorum]|nr:Copine [Phytophthora cactorum]